MAIIIITRRQARKNNGNRERRTRLGLTRVCGKKFFLGAGCGVWGFTSFEVANYLIFREKVPKFPPDHSHIQYFLIDKRSKSLTQQGF
ncbi:MAG: hypothetical protein DWQ53_10575 [Microcystis flos-aquae DF17]|nr:MAG: hypothetical protein DWQ53_10575 [Microcystis flos-aquae DF17]